MYSKGTTGFNHAAHLYHTMLKKMLGLLLDMMITAAIFSVFFLKSNDFVYYLAVFLFCTSTLGLINAVFCPLREVCRDGFKLSYYLTTIVQSGILFATKYWFLGCMFLAVMIVVLIKNLIGMRLYRDDEIFISDRFNGPG